VAILSGRKARAKDAPTSGTPEWAIAWLLSGRPPEAGEDGAAEYSEKVLPLAGRGEREAWERWGRDALAVWVKDNPGTRPLFWWRRVAQECRRVKPSREFYIREDQGRPGNVRGLPLVWSQRDGEMLFSGKVMVESEASYLKRLGLLLPGEGRRLKASDYRMVQLEVGA
jgi:hypothetical protein